jgi:hypothetical protein
MSDKETVEKLKKETQRFQEKLDAILKTIKVINPKGSDLLQMANAYFKDSYHFAKKGDLVPAFEAVNIAWGYLDSGLRLGFFEVPVELKKWFTAD